MKAPRSVRHEIRVADEVWLATALLHREHPRRRDFEVSEIVERARQEGITRRLRPGVRVHVLLHCVANRPPNPAGYRMLFATGRTTRRLYRPGDPTHPARRGKTVPDRNAVPPEYQGLLDWYHAQYSARAAASVRTDPLLALRGSGKSLWADEHADDYVRRLREGWA
ncbi:MAG TPA: hypothetical protein VIE37_01265 [Methylomirabilota bacterium]